MLVFLLSTYRMSFVKNDSYYVLLEEDAGSTKPNNFNVFWLPRVDDSAAWNHQQQQSFPINVQPWHYKNNFINKIC